MKGEAARIRNAVRRIDAAEKWLVDNAFEPTPRQWTTYRQWKEDQKKHRNERTDAIEALIQACRDYLKPAR